MAIIINPINVLEINNIRSIPIPIQNKINPINFFILPPSYTFVTLYAKNKINILFVYFVSSGKAISTASSSAIIVSFFAVNFSIISGIKSITFVTES